MMEQCSRAPACLSHRLQPPSSLQGMACKPRSTMVAPQHGRTRRGLSLANTPAKCSCTTEARHNTQHGTTPSSSSSSTAQHSNSKAAHLWRQLGCSRLGIADLLHDCKALAQRIHAGGARNSGRQPGHAVGLRCGTRRETAEVRLHSHHSGAWRYTLKDGGQLQQHRSRREPQRAAEEPRRWHDRCIAH